MIDCKTGKLFEFDKSYSDFTVGNFLDIKQIAELGIEEGGYIKEHTQICHEITYVISGKGTFIKNGISEKFSADDIQYTTIGDTHALYCDLKSKLRYFCIGFNFNQNTPIEFLPLKIFFENLKVNKLHCNNTIKVYFNNLLNELYNENSYFILNTEYLIKLILINFKRLADNEISKKFPSVENGRIIGPTVYLTIKYIDENIKSVKGVKDISNALSFNPDYLSNIFKKKTGETIGKYIKKKKLQMAYDLIKEDNLSITDTSNYLGFSSPQIFTKSFKKFYGYSPSDIKLRK